MHVFYVCLQADELAESVSALVAHEIFAFIMNRFDVNSQAITAHDGFVAMGTGQLFLRVTQPFNAVGLLFVFCQGSKGVERGSASIAQPRSPILVVVLSIATV